MPIIVFQHSPVGGPGRIAATLRDHGLKLDIRRLDVDGARALPRDLDNVQGLVTLGGPQNVGEAHDWMPGEMDLIREAHARKLPVVGVCLGAQLIAAALGGTVGPMLAADGTPRREWGFADVHLTPAGQTEPLLAGIAWTSKQFHAHGQEVKQLPPDAVLLGSSAMCKVQVFRAGLRTLAVQHHFECDMEMIRALVADSPRSIAQAGLTPEQVLQQAERHYEMYARLADRLCVNIATLLFPITRRMAI